MKKLWFLIRVMAIGMMAIGTMVIVGCGQPAPDVVPGVTAVPLPTSAALPPTFTPPATAVLPPTQTPRPTPTTAATATSIDFDKTAVELRYTIPAIGLDRRLRGNISGQITVVDETTTQSESNNNQSGILIELQQILSDVTLESLPDGCDTCVQLAFDLPLEDKSGDGWLQDTALLVSLDNFLTGVLGPHFPPGTQLGLRRSISPYAPAHTVALTEDGRLWRWLATDSQIADPEEVADINLLPLLTAVPLDELAGEYRVDCEGALPIENLFISPAKLPIRITCPQFSLPSTLLPLYLALDALLAPAIADVSVPRPPSAFPLAALLDYQRADALRLTIYQDDRAVVMGAADTYTTTLSHAQVISLTTELLAGGQLQPGLTSFQPTATPVITATAVAVPAASSRLLVRGPEGVFDGQWTGIPDLTTLNDLLDSLLPDRDVTPTPAGTAVIPEPTVTPTSNS